jgi:lipopolysaccharide transport system permease protein
MLMVFWTYYWQQGLVAPTIKMLYLPVFLVLMALLALGVGLLVAAITTKYRDVSHFLGFGVTLLMYASPVIYSMNQVPSQYQSVLNFNPLAPILEGFRYCLTGAGQLSWSGLGFSTLTVLILLTIGAFLFNRTEKTFMDTV